MTIIALEALTFGLNRLAAAAHAKGESICLLTRDKSRYLYELAQDKANRIHIINVNTFDQEAVEAAIQKIPNAKGLLSMTDTWSLVSLDIAKALGFPSQNADSVRLVRDKHKLRNYLFSNKLSKGSSLCVDPKVSQSIRYVNPSNIRSSLKMQWVRVARTYGWRKIMRMWSVS